MINNLFSAVYLVLKKFVLFFIAGIMCLNTFSPTEPEQPQILNNNTGDFFLPDYGHTLISSHRSGKGAAPENTLRAINSNLVYSDSDSPVMEMDVQLTKDGEIVLYHSLFLEENSDSEEYFGHKYVTVFSKTYEELRGLNFGENFMIDDEYPFRGLRGDEIPDDIRITKLYDVFETIEREAPGKFRYVIEVKYPHPWAPKIVDGIYEMANEYDMTDRVVVASFWPDVSSYLDKHYDGKLNRSANPFEIVSFYGSYIRNEQLNPEDIKYDSLQMPYYWDDGKLLVANLGRASFIDYAHKYGLSVQYWTVNSPEDAKFLAESGADMLMTDYPDRIREALYGTAE